MPDAQVSNGTSPPYLSRMPEISLSAEERRMAMETCRAVLAGNLGIIEGARRLDESPRVLASVADGDPSVAILGSLAFETAHLVGDSGGLFDEASLAERNAERTRVEALVRDDVLAACRALLGRLGAAS